MYYFNSTPLFSFLIFASVIVGRIFFLRKNRIQIVTKTREKNKIATILFPVFGFIFLLWFIELIKPVFQVSISILPEYLTDISINSVSLKLVGTFLMTISIVLLVITLIHFKTSLRFGLSENNLGKLITDGIFAYSRNPFFLSIILQLTGISLVLTTPFFVAFALISIVSIHFFIHKEEKFMRNQYGNEYKKYCSKVRRYF